MRALTPTKLPLATFARYMGLDPLHFAGINVPDRGDVHCNAPIYQHEWQSSDQSSREEMARCIAQAEADIEEFVGYRLLPSWEVAEPQMVQGPGDPLLVNYNGRNLRGYPNSVITKWKHVISGGVRATTLIKLGATVAWWDLDNDGYDELATAVAPYATTSDACEIRAYYPGHGPDPAWEIKPLSSVAFAGGNVTVGFRRELVVAEAIQDAIIGPRTAEGLVDADFLTTVNLYREYNDPQSQVTYVWEPTGGCDCTNGCVQCSLSAQAGGCLNPRDSRLGIMFYQPGTWNAVTSQFDSASWSVSRQPDQVRLSYLAGLQDLRKTCPRRDMDDDWARTVAIYAASMLDRNPCNCAADVFQQWRDDLAYQAGATELASYALTPSDLACPFGTRRGAIYAWKRILRRPDSRVATQAVPIT